MRPAQNVGPKRSPGNRRILGSADVLARKAEGTRDPKNQHRLCQFAPAESAWWKFLPVGRLETRLDFFLRK